MKRVLFVISLLVLCLTAFRPLEAQAADGVPNIDAVLVLDASNSMNASDPSKLSIEAMKMFIDMLSVNEDKVGVVSYTDQIEREKAMTTIRDANDKTVLKDFISQLKRGAYTDITVGLDEALRMMDDAHVSSHKPMIIMLTDGNIELDERKGKTLDDAARETERIISEAQTKGYPIYTIGLNYDGNLNRQYIENIAVQTGALCFETQSANDLPDILSAIFADQMELNIINAGQIQADGAFQNVEVNIPDPNIVEANITFLSNQPVEIELYDPAGGRVAFNGSDAILTQSASYSLLKVITPRQGLWTLRVKGVNGDNIKINLLYHYSVDIRMALDNPNPGAGDTVRTSVTLWEGGQPTQREALYEDSICTLTVLDRNQTAISYTPIYTAVYQNGAFTADFELPEAHTYDIVARVEHPNFFRETTLSITVPQIAPSSSPDPATPPPATSTPATPIPTPQATQAPETIPDAAIPWYIWLIGGLVVVGVLVILFVLFRSSKKNMRVFTGRLVIEVTDHYTNEKSAPQYRNLIEYGRRTNLQALLNGAVSPLLSGVIITPSPTAPSHMPQIIIKCTHPQVKFKKDFMEQDASHGISMSLKSELIIVLEAENKQVKLRYTE